MTAHKIAVSEPLRPGILSEIWLCRKTYAQGRRADEAVLRCNLSLTTPECASPARLEELMQTLGSMWIPLGPDCGCPRQMIVPAKCKVGIVLPGYGNAEGSSAAKTF
jgi:hypothetical protein